MKFLVNNIRLPLDENIENLKAEACKCLNIQGTDLKSFKVVRESIDARRKNKINLVYSVLVETEVEITNLNSTDIRIVEDLKEDVIIPGDKKMNNRPIIVGTGPAGLFAGIVLAKNGYKPLIIERGDNVDKRAENVQKYWETGKLDTESNVQFGEGGAGTFSDGKLTTRINDRRCDMVLEEFFDLGAPEEILYKAKPHIGSEGLRQIVKNARKKIESLGGEFRFNSKLTSLVTKDNKIIGAVINEKDEIATDVIVLAIGHSARDTYEMLLNQGVVINQKPFSVGVRIEHLQEEIDKAQFGRHAGHPKLGASDYQLSYKNGERTVYSFCMCPGGMVVASASEQNTIVTNGMSEFARDKRNANSALVVSVRPEDFGSSHPLAGIEFQRKWERLAFEVGGSKNAAPVQRLEDFVNGVTTSNLGRIQPSYTGETEFADINKCLPEFVTSSIKDSIGYFDRKLRGFNTGDAILTGVETRTSSPVRILRNDLLEAVGHSGLYPAGEGAGYAGGIVSAAVDGIKIAEQIIKTYTQPV